VVIVGGGRVGRITSKALQQAGIVPVIIERAAERVTEHPEAVIGDATRMETLKAAKARDAASSQGSSSSPGAENQNIFTCNLNISRLQTRHETIAIGAVSD
jgi:Trk K+ transport system NAD-binding subunit